MIINCRAFLVRETLLIFVTIYLYVTTIIIIIYIYYCYTISDNNMYSDKNDYNQKLLQLQLL